jgi:hypothetical protein
MSNLPTVVLVRGAERQQISRGYMFAFDEAPLYCAKIEPSVSGVEYVHFRGFLLGEFSICFDGISLNLQQHTLYTLTLIEPSK